MDAKGLLSKMKDEDLMKAYHALWKGYVNVSNELTSRGIALPPHGAAAASTGAAAASSGNGGGGEKTPKRKSVLLVRGADGRWSERIARPRRRHRAPSEPGPHNCKTCSAAISADDPVADECLSCVNRTEHHCCSCTSTVTDITDARSQMGYCSYCDRIQRCQPVIPPRPAASCVVGCIVCNSPIDGGSGSNRCPVCTSFARANRDDECYEDERAKREMSK